MARLRFAWRSLAKAPLLSLTVVLSVGLGIGANTAIFSLFHQILLNSLPVERPEELVTVTSPGDFKGGRNSTDNSGDMHYIFSYPMFRELEKRPQGMSGIAAFRSLNANLSFRKQTISGEMLFVSGGYFATLGVRPLMGRTIGREDDTGAGNAVAVLSYGYWSDRLGGESAVLNQPIRVNGQMFTVVGVGRGGGGGAQGFHGDGVGGRARRVHSAGLQAVDDAQLERDGPLERQLAVPDRAAAKGLFPGAGAGRAEQRVRGTVGAAIQNAAVLLPETDRPFSQIAADAEGWQPRAERHEGRNQDAADHPDGRHGAGAVDRHGECGEPAAGAECATAAGDGDPGRDGSGARRVDGADVDGGPAAGRGGRSGGPGVRGAHPQAAVCRNGGRSSDSLPGGAPGMAGARVRAWPGRGDGAAVRTVPGVGGGPSVIGGHVEGRIGAEFGNGGGGARTQVAGVRAGDGIGGAADSDGALPEEPGEPDARRPGDEDGERDRLRGGAGAEWI